MGVTQAFGNNRQWQGLNKRLTAKEMAADLSGDHQKTIGTDKNNVSAVFGLHVIAYNLIRLGKLP